MPTDNENYLARFYAVLNDGLKEVSTAINEIKVNIDNCVIEPMITDAENILVFRIRRMNQHTLDELLGRTTNNSRKFHGKPMRRKK